MRIVLTLSGAEDVSEELRASVTKKNLRVIS